MSWALEGYINDFGIANMAKKLAAKPGTAAAQRARLSEEHEYFINRARNYVNMFDPRIGFFQGRAADGRFKSPPDEYDPREWGHEHDYTETNGWNFAFHAPQDGQGLANLYGGRDGLAAKLDEFFATPETAKFPGSYGGIIHEMVEARDVRMGQWGFSNQVSHHILYMYDYAGQPRQDAGEGARGAARGCTSAREIGQGYAGDEDNGETSAWYLFSALGFYPLQVGSPYYAIGSPLFKKATIHLDERHDIVINAPDNSARNVYVQGLKVDGRADDKAYLDHAALADGATLDFDMGPAPSDWATGADAAPPSITQGDGVPSPLHDATGADEDAASTSTAGADAGALFDDTSGTRAASAGAAPWVAYRFADGAKHVARFYTLTSGDDEAADPSSWTLKGSNDGATWQVIDRRSEESFDWRPQTRPFKLDRPSNFSRFRIEFADAAVTLAEVELLTTEKRAPAPLSAEVVNGVAEAGGTASVGVKLRNDGSAPLSGEVTATVPEGWTVEPPPTPFGPLAPGASETAHVERRRARGDAGRAAIRSRDRDLAARDRRGHRHRARGRRHGRVHPGDRRRGAVAGRRRRLAAQRRRLRRPRALRRQRALLRLPLPDSTEDVTGGTLEPGHRHEFLVQASTDGESWRTVLEETRRITDGSNRALARARRLDDSRRRAARSTSGSPTASRRTAGAAGWRG